MGPVIPGHTWILFLDLFSTTLKYLRKKIQSKPWGKLIDQYSIYTECQPPIVNCQSDANCNIYCASQIFNQVTFVDCITHLFTRRPDKLLSAFMTMQILQTRSVWRVSQAMHFHNNRILKLVHSCENGSTITEPINDLRYKNSSLHD